LSLHDALPISLLEWSSGWSCPHRPAGTASAPRRSPFSASGLMFAFTFAGTFWRRFVERRIERHGQRRVEALRTTAPSAAARSDGLVGRFSVFTRLTVSISNHSWPASLIAAVLSIFLFG